MRKTLISHKFHTHERGLEYKGGVDRCQMEDKMTLDILLNAGIFVGTLVIAVTGVITISKREPPKRKTWLERFLARPARR